MTTIVEIVKFKLKEGFTLNDFDSIDEKLKTFLNKQEGLLNRTVCFDEKEQLYTDIVHWQDLDSANKAQDAYFESSVCAELGNMVEQSSVVLNHSRILSSLPKA